jgi:hypothetical protein
MLVIRYQLARTTQAGCYSRVSSCPGSNRKAKDLAIVGNNPETFETIPGDGLNAGGMKDLKKEKRSTRQTLSSHPYELVARVLKLFSYILFVY